MSKLPQELVELLSIVDSEKRLTGYYAIGFYLTYVYLPHAENVFTAGDAHIVLRRAIFKINELAILDTASASKIAMNVYNHSIGTTTPKDMIDTGIILPEHNPILEVLRVYKFISNTDMDIIVKNNKHFNKILTLLTINDDKL